MKVMWASWRLCEVDEGHVRFVKVVWGVWRSFEIHSFIHSGHFYSAPSRLMYCRSYEGWRSCEVDVSHVSSMKVMWGLCVVMKFQMCCKQLVELVQFSYSRCEIDCSVISVKWLLQFLSHSSFQIYDAIRFCWASLFAHTAVAYRRYFTQLPVVTGNSSQTSSSSIVVVIIIFMEFKLI